MVVAAVLVSAGCLDLSTDPDEVVAIDFAPLPWPSVAAGDTLRDSSGAVAPLRAHLLAGDGSEVIGGPVEFLVEAGAVRVASDSFLVADDTAKGTARIRASTTAIQSIPRQVEIVLAPDSLASDVTIEPILWVVPDDPRTNVSAPLDFRILSLATDPAKGVRSWVAFFTLSSEGRIIPPGDTSGVYLVGENGLPSWADTSDAGGKVSRRLRVRISPGFTPPDSVRVTVQASYRGTSLRGAPMTLVLPLAAR